MIFPVIATIDKIIIIFFLIFPKHIICSYDYKKIIPFHSFNIYVSRNNSYKFSWDIKLLYHYYCHQLHLNYVVRRVLLLILFLLLAGSSLTPSHSLSTKVISYNSLCLLSFPCSIHPLVFFRAISTRSLYRAQVCHTNNTYIFIIVASATAVFVVVYKEEELLFTVEEGSRGN